MKIDFIINKLSGGGAERVLTILANYFSEKGYEVRAITFIEVDVDSYELNSTVNRVRLHSHRLFSSVTVNGFYNLKKFYKKKSNRPDIISSHINLIGLVTIPIAKLYGIKVIVSEHNNHFTKSTFAKRFLWNHFYKYADAITILTNFDLDYFNKRNKNVWLMPNPCTFKPVDIEKLPPNQSKQIVSIGSLNRYDHKGFDNLLHIANEVLKKNPDWSFKIVGDGDSGMDYLTKLSSNLGLQDNVIFTGFRKDIKNILSESSIYILPSRYEGLPMTLLEAMSQGVCCIAYDCISGPSDVITNNFDGVLVENQNKLEMIEKLDYLIKNPQERERLRRNAPKALDKFSLNNVGENWERLFISLISKN